MENIVGFILVVFVVYGFFRGGGSMTSQSAIDATILTLFVFWFIRFIINKQKASKKQREKLKYEEEQEKQRKINIEQQIVKAHSNLKSIITSSENEFNKLPNFIEDSKWYLDKAEDEFSDGAFAPFWDAIESATNSLAAYHQNINQLTRTTQDYDIKANEFSLWINKINYGVVYNIKNQPFTIEAPEFKLPLGKLPDAIPTAERLAKIVRKAQKDFHFATIYEQRKTNQLLYQGFRSLGDAIYSIGSEISFSLDGLSNKLNVSLSDLLESSHEQNRIISKHNTDMERHADNLQRLSEKESSSRREFEKASLRRQDKQDEKLDNIQRGRKPPI